MKAHIKMINFISGFLKSFKPIISAHSSLLQDSHVTEGQVTKKRRVSLGPLIPISYDTNITSNLSVPTWSCHQFPSAKSGLTKTLPSDEPGQEKG